MPNISPKAPPQDLPKMLRAKQCAEYLGVSLPSWWRWAREGKIPKGIKLSSRITVWFEDDIKSILTRKDP